MAKKLYTLEEAYEEIFRIKKEMIGDPLEHLKKIENAAEMRGYTRACKDISEVMAGKVSLLKSIYGS